MGAVNKPSAKPVVPGKMVIRRMYLPYLGYHLHLNDPYFELDELEEVGKQILSLVKAARRDK